MASNYWIKLYHEILDDPKMGQLTDRLYKRTIQLFLLAGDYDKEGMLPTLADMAWRLRVNQDELETELVELSRKGIITIDSETFLVTNFMIRQMAMSNSERARRWREKNTGTQWAKKLYAGIPSSPGIYSMKCKKTGKRYIGATNNLQIRIRQNLYTISKDEHPMSSDILDYGIETLEVEVLEQIDDETKLASAEQKWISQFPTDDLYNRETPKPHQNWKETDDNRIANEKRTKRSQIKEEDKDKDKEEEATAVVFSHFQNEITMLTPSLADRVGGWIDDYPVDWITEAIDIAVSRSKRRPDYIEGILRKWKSDGKDSGTKKQLTTLEMLAEGGYK